MAVDIELIKRLKDLTGVGLTDAKRALEESKGDFDKALSEMRKKGLTKAEKRSERETRSGLVGNYNHDGRIGVIVEVNCETDFVAKNEIFVNLVKDIAMHIAAANPDYVEENQIPEDVLNKIRKEYADKAKLEKKPDNMIEKIVDGQIKKFGEEHCLISQPYIKNPDITVKDLITDHISRLGENIVVRRFSRIALGEINN